MSPLQDTDVLAISRNDPTTAGTYQLPVGDLKAYIAAAPVKPDWNAAPTAPNGILNRPGLATSTTSGLMSGADKTKLDGLGGTGGYVSKAGDIMTGSLNVTNSGNINILATKGGLGIYSGALRVTDSSSGIELCALGGFGTGAALTSPGQLTLSSGSGVNGGVVISSAQNYINCTGELVVTRGDDGIPALTSDIHILTTPTRIGILSFGNTNSDLNHTIRSTNGANTLAIRNETGDMTFRIGPGKVINYSAGTANIARVNADGTWSVLSDRKHKKNVAGLKHGLDAVMRLKPVSFDHTGGQGPPESMPAGVPGIGFIAQEVEEVIPEAVIPADSEHDSMLTLTHLIPVLVKAVQELAARVQTLEGAT